MIPVLLTLCLSTCLTAGSPVLPGDVLHDVYSVLVKDLATAFSKETLPVVGQNEVICELCEFLVQMTDNLLKNRTSPAEANATVFKVCDVFPEVLKDTCISLAPEIVKMMLDGVDPVGACTNLGLCLNEAKESAVKTPKKMLAAGPACELCELLVQVVDQYLKDNKTDAAINATIYKICNDLSGTLKDTCLIFAPQLVAVLSKGVNPQQACTTIKLCTATDGRKTSRSVSDLRAGPACELCELLVQTVDLYLKENKTEAAINATVYKLCNDLPGTIKDTCLAFAPLLVSTLSKGVDPKVACTTIKLCASTENRISLSEIQVPAASPACELCDLLVQTIDLYLKDNKTEAAINATVYKLCNDLPGTIKDTCLAFAPQLVLVISKGVDPALACTTIKLCVATEKQVVRRSVQRLAAGPACELCELLVQTIDLYLEDNKTEAAINATVYKLCNDLPGTIKDTCLAFAPLLVSTLSKGVDPKVACTTIKLCDSTENRISLSEIQVPAAGPACELCELLVQTIDLYLKDKKTEAAINATVYKLCNDLPGTIKDTCLGFAPLVVSALAKGVDPAKACSTIKLCTSLASSTLTRPASASLQQHQGAASMWCTICKDHIEILNEAMYRDEEPVEHFLENICHRLPPPTDQACLSAVDTKFPEMWESFLNGTASTDNVCKLLQACP